MTGLLTLVVLTLGLPAAAEAPAGRQDEAAKIIAEMKERIGEGAIVEKVDKIFIVGTDDSRRRLNRCKRTVTSMQRGLYKDFLKKKPTKPLKVYLFKGEKSYKAYCEDYLNESPGTPFGFYRDSDRSLIMNIATGTGTLAHELVHPLAAADFEKIPAWFNEGFASLYEQSTTKTDGTIWGLVNWRLPGLKEGLEDVELAALMKTTTGKFYGRGSGLRYAAARYLCLYLQEQGKLPEFYRAFRDTFKKDKTGITQLEKVTGRTLADLEADWKKWVSKLRWR